MTAALCTYVVLKHAATERQEVMSDLIDWRYWFNRSTAHDYGVMCLNAGLRTSLWLPLIGSQLVGTPSWQEHYVITSAFLSPSCGTQ